MSRLAVLAWLLPAMLGAAYEWGGPAARGHEALKAGRHADAIAAFREARRDLPLSAALRYDEAIALERSGSWAEAEAAYRAALERRGGRARNSAAFNLGARALRERQPATAVSWFRESLKIRPKDAEAKRALEEAIRRMREAPPRTATNPPPPGSGGGPGTPNDSTPAPPPLRKPTASPPDGRFTPEEARHWLDALEAERRAARRQRGGGGTGGGRGGERDW